MDLLTLKKTIAEIEIGRGALLTRKQLIFDLCFGHFHLAHIYSHYFLPRRDKHCESGLVTTYEKWLNIMGEREREFWNFKKLQVAKSF